MARRLVLTRAAERDLEEQVELIAAERPAVARRYVSAVQGAFERLRALPGLGAPRSVPVREHGDVRVWPVPGFRRFVIVYRGSEKVVEVVRVLHSARDLTRILRRSRP